MDIKKPFTAFSSYERNILLTIFCRQYYRSCALFAGFLNANPKPENRAVVANYGLMDQIAALHWLKENIGLFGGDRSNVTLIGHGTGAACIHFLMMSPAVSGE